MHNERVFKIRFEADSDKEKIKTLTKDLTGLAKQYAKIQNGIDIKINLNKDFDAQIMAIQEKLDALKKVDVNLNASGKIEMSGIQGGVTVTNTSPVQITDSSNINIASGSHVHIEKGAFSGFSSERLNEALSIVKQINDAITNASNYASESSDKANKKSAKIPVGIDAESSQEKIETEIEKLVKKIQKNVNTREINTVFIPVRAKADENQDLSVDVIEPLKKKFDEIKDSSPLYLTPKIGNIEDGDIALAIKNISQKVKNLRKIGEAGIVQLPTKLREITQPEINAQIVGINNLINKSVDSVVELNAKVKLLYDEDSEDGLKLKIDSASLMQEIAYAVDIGVRAYNNTDDTKTEKLKVKADVVFADKSDQIKLTVNQKHITTEIKNAVKTAIGDYNSNDKKEPIKLSPKITAKSIRDSLEKAISEIKNPPVLPVAVSPTKDSLTKLGEQFSDVMQKGFRQALKNALKEESGTMTDAFSKAKRNSSSSSGTSRTSSSKTENWNEMTAQEVREIFLRELNNGARSGSAGYYRPGDLNNRSRENLGKYIEQMRKIKSESAESAEYERRVNEEIKIRLKLENDIFKLRDKIISQISKQSGNWMNKEDAEYAGNLRATLERINDGEIAKVDVGDLGHYLNVLNNVNDSLNKHIEENKELEDVQKKSANQLKENVAAYVERQKAEDEAAKAAKKAADEEAKRVEKQTNLYEKQIGLMEKALQLSRETRRSGNTSGSSGVSNVINQLTNNGISPVTPGDPNSVLSNETLKDREYFLNNIDETLKKLTTDQTNYTKALAESEKILQKTQETEYKIAQDRQKRFEKQSDLLNEIYNQQARLAELSGYNNVDVGVLQAASDALRQAQDSLSGDPSSDVLHSAERSLKEIIGSINDIDKAIVKPKSAIESLISRVEGFVKSKDMMRANPDNLAENFVGTPEQLQNIINTREALIALRDEIVNLNRELTADEAANYTVQFEKAANNFERAIHGVWKKSNKSDFYEFPSQSVLDRIEEYKRKILSLNDIAPNTTVQWTTKTEGDIVRLTGKFEDQSGALRTLSYEVDTVNGGMRSLANTEKESLTFVERMTKLFKQRGEALIAYIGTFASFYRIMSEVRQGVEIVKQLDTNMTELRRVSGATRSELAAFKNTVFDMGREIGSSGDTIIKLAADYARLGYSLSEASELARSSAIYMNVGFIDDANFAMESLTSTMKAYGMQASEVADIVDKFNEVGKLLPLNGYIGQRVGTPETELRTNMLPRCA